MYQVDVEKAVRTYADMVYRLAVARTDQRADAEEVFSEVFLRLVRYSAKIQSEEHLRAWLLRATIQCAAGVYAAPWKKRVVLMEGDDFAGTSVEQEFPGEAVVLPQVQKLAGKYRDVIHLYYYEGYGIHEISAILHKKEGTVKSLLFRAREKLEKALAENDPALP